MADTTNTGGICPKQTPTYSEISATVLNALNGIDAAKIVLKNEGCMEACSAEWALSVVSESLSDLYDNIADSNGQEREA